MTRYQGIGIVCFFLLTTFGLYTVAQGQDIQVDKVTAEKIPTRETTLPKERAEEKNLQDVIPEEQRIPPKVPVYEEPKGEVEEGYRFYKIDPKTGEKTLIRTIDQQALPSRTDRSSSFPGIYTSFKNLEKQEFQQGTDTGNVIQKFSSYKQVSNPQSQANRKNVKVLMDIGGKNGVCSGTLIGDEWVMTAGHCLHDDDSDKTAKRVRVVPAYEHTKSAFDDWDLSGATKPFGVAEARNLFITQGWLNKGAFKFDMAIIQLDRPVGVVTGWYGYDYKGSGTFYKNNKMYNKSYPSETSAYTGGTMYKMKGEWDFFPQTRIVNGAQSKLLCQNRIGRGGSSGSSVYDVKNSNRTVYAVFSHTKLDNDDNRKAPSCYTRVNQTKFNWVGNNISNNRPSNFDLALLNVEGSPKRPVEGEQLSDLSFIAYNRSTSSKSGTWNFDVYLSDDSTISGKDTVIGSFQFTHNFSGQEAVKVKLDAQDVPSLPLNNTGKHWIAIAVDSTDSQDDNNLTTGWDLLPIDIKSAEEVTFAAYDVLKEPTINFPTDLRGNFTAQTNYTAHYKSGTSIIFDAPRFSGGSEFVEWEYDGMHLDSSRYAEVGVDSVSNLSAIYHTPEIPVTPRKIYTTKLELQSGSTKETLTIINTAPVSQDWEMSTKHNSSWLTLTDTSGSVPADSRQNVEIRINSSNVTEGVYKDTVVVTGPYISESTDIEVILDATAHNATAPSPEEVYRMNNIVPDALLGMDIDINTDDGLLSLGVPGLDGRWGGCMIKEYVDGQWTDGTLIKPEGLATGAKFGFSIASFTQNGIPYMLAGAPGSGGAFKTTTETAGNKAILFHRNDSQWVRDTLIDDGEAGAGFGYALDAAMYPNSNDFYHFIAAGAPNQDYENQNSTGSVEVYFMQAGDFVLEKTIYPENYSQGLNMGASVDMVTKGDFTYLAIGAPADSSAEYRGRVVVYQFNYDTETWQLQDQIFEPEGLNQSGFGSSVKLMKKDGKSMLVVGAPKADVEAENSGAVISYEFTDGVWTSPRLLLPDEIAMNAGAGSSLDLFKTANSTYLMMGLPYRMAGNESTSSGKTALFKQNDGSDKWLHRSTFRSEEIGDGAGMGRNVGIMPVNGQMQFISSAPYTSIDGNSNAGQSFGYTLQDAATLPAVELDSTRYFVKVPERNNADKTLIIRSTGKMELSWSLDALPGWLSTSARSGRIAPGQQSELTLDFHSAKRDTGTYRDTLLMTTNDMDRDSIRLSVGMRVTELNEVDLRPLELVAGETDSLEAGNSLQSPLTVYLSNRGSDPADSTIHVGLYLSADSAVSSKDSLMASTRIDSGLAPEEGLNLELGQGAHVPMSYEASENYLIVKADFPEMIDEIDDSNNLIMEPTYVTEAIHPNLEILRPSPNDTIMVTMQKDGSAERMIEMQNSGQQILDFSVPGFGRYSAANYDVNSVQATGVDSIPAFLENVDPAASSIQSGGLDTIRISFTATDLENGIYYDTLSVVTNDPNNSSVIYPLKVQIGEDSDLQNPSQKPEDFALQQNYPNPFNPVTRIRYALPEAVRVKIEVFNVLGRRVAKLVDKKQSAGRYIVTFDGRSLSSGTYLYRIQAGSFQAIRKMLLVK